MSTDSTDTETTTKPARVEYEGSRFDALTNSAYARWQTMDCDRRTWLLHLDVEERNAAVLAGYIGQVNNGGHQQWLGNRYHAADRTFLDFALDRLAEHDKDAVEQARRFIREASRHEDVILHGPEAAWDRVDDVLGALDDEFYDTDLSDRLVAAAEAHFASRGGAA